MKDGGKVIDGDKIVWAIVPGFLLFIAMVWAAQSPVLGAILAYLAGRISQREQTASKS